MSLRLIWLLPLSSIFALVGCDNDPSRPPAPTTTATATATATPTPTPDIVAELQEVGTAAYLGRPVPDPTIERRWIRYDFEISEDGPICLYGDPYRTYVRPAASNNVLFYLEGGGACWNNNTCWNNTRAKIDANPIAPLTIFRGVFDSEDPGNVFADWNIIYVPYCDGSVFTGDNVADYADGRVYHRGLSNLSAGVDVMMANFPNPDKIVVSGSSAGGFGTFSGYGVMRSAYPDHEILVLNDSGPGVQNNDDPGALADRRENWQFDRLVPNSCDECSIQPTFITDWAMQRDPRLRGAFFSTLEDAVIRGFLGLSGPEYAALLLDVTDEIHARHPNRAKRFMVQDDFHTILLGAGLGGDGIAALYRTLAIDGVVLPEWVAEFVNDGPGWVDLVEGR